MKLVRKVLVGMAVLSSLAPPSALSGMCDYCGCCDGGECCIAGQCYQQSTICNINAGWFIAGPLVIGGLVALYYAASSDSGSHH